MWVVWVIGAHPRVGVPKAREAHPRREIAEGGIVVAAAAVGGGLELASGEARLDLEASLVKIGLAHVVRAQVGAGAVLALGLIAGAFLFINVEQ